MCYLEQQRRKRMLASATGRLLRPKLSASLAHWKGEWVAEEKRKADEKATEKERIRREREEKKLREEIGRLEAALRRGWARTARRARRSPHLVARHGAFLSAGPGVCLLFGGRRGGRRRL